MPRVSRCFFAIGIAYVITGMLLGMYMGGSEDFKLMPVHAHLNLIGWVTGSLYGTFYTLADDSARRFAWVTFWLNNVGVIVLLPSLALLLISGPAYVVPTVIGEFLVLAAAISFATGVWGYLRR